MNKVLTAASVLLLVGAMPVSSASDSSMNSHASMAPEMARGGDISACGTLITEPGQYRVAKDLYCEPDQQGIWVFSSKVTVDLRGHTIFCDAANSVEPVGAVLVGDFFDPDLVVENVRVKNGTVSGCDDGVVYFFTESGTITNITSTNNSSGGITLIDAQNTMVKKNVGFDNLETIQSFGGTNNEFKHNSSTGALDASLLIAGGETGARLLCNTSEQDGSGIAVGPFSSANIIRGNYINNPFVAGITMYGLLLPDDFLIDAPSGNVIEKNIAQGSGAVDLSELIFNPNTGEVFLADDAQCGNTWKKNQYVSWFGPEDCVAPPVLLDDDVCGFNDDDHD